jgi:hypothetical protein
MTIAIDHSKIGPSGRPILSLKRKTQPATVSAPRPIPASVPPSVSAPGPTFKPPVAKPLNNRQRKALERHKAADEAMLWLRQKYPAAFNYDYRPLALNTRDSIADIMAQSGITFRALGDAIRRHTEHTRYLFQLSQPEAVRIDLNGNPVEPVSDVHREHAAERLATAKLEITKRKQQQRAAKIAKREARK